MTRTKRYSRLWLVGVLAALVALAQLGWGANAPAGAQEEESCAGKGLPPEQVGVQMWTYFQAIQADGVEAVIEHIGEVGMTNIERFGGIFDAADFDAYAQMFADNGVTATANHGSLDPATFADVIAEQKQLGAEFIGSAGVGPPGYDSLDDVLATADNLDTLGDQAAAEGLRLFVHNHDGEIATTYPYDLDGDGEDEETSVIEILLAETDADVNWEMDVHWTRVGLAELHGHDIDSAANQEALRALGTKYADRIALLHVKGTAADGSITDVGAGTTDWPAFFETVPNVVYYFSEYDFPPNAYDSAETAFEYLTCGLYDAGDQSIAVTVPEPVDTGEFLWTIEGDGSVNLGDMADEGTHLRATGPIDPISVTDTRTGGPTWSISGQVSDFDPGGLGGNHLGWTPQVLTEGAGATAGAAVASGIDGGDGLSVPATLASAEDGHEAGTGLVGADLDLRFPVETDPGEYTATLTITALS